jgi:hypothetical protein
MDRRGDTMPDNDKLKSSYELAMERLRERDRELGIDEPKPLTREQKERIAELRQQAEAKRAELQILHGKRVAEAQGDPEKLREEEEHFQTDSARIESWLESAVADVKKE